MTIRNPRRNVFWPSHVRIGNDIVSIADAWKAGEISLEARGSVADGWCIYLVADQDHPMRAQQISPVFSREQGDTRQGMLDRAAMLYGRKVPVSKYMHPMAECWIFATHEAPKTPEQIEAEQQKAIAARVESARNRFGKDTAGCLEWLDTERKQALYIAANSMNAGERDKSTKEAELLREAIAKMKAEPVAQVAPITAADDIAFWTLEACKQPNVPLWANLDIPADVAEDIDAANWTVGSGLKDASGRREIFRQRRAEAYAAVYPDHAAELAAEKAAEAAPFDAAKVTITRKRFSATQGEVLVEYDGRRIEQYGDNIKLAETGAWEGEPDAYWIAVAAREAVRRGFASIFEHKAELVEQTPAIVGTDADAQEVAAVTGHFPIAVRIAINVQNDNPNTIWNKLKARLGREPTNQECRDEVRRIIREADGSPAQEIEQTERLPAPPVTRAVYTVTGREADGQGGERIVFADFNTRAEAEAYRAEREVRWPHQPGKIVGMVLDRNKAAEAADEMAGIKTGFFGWRERDYNS